MASNVIELEDAIKVRLAARPKLVADPREAKDLEVARAIERARKDFLDNFGKLVRWEGARPTIEWAEKAIEQFKVGMQP
jgi:hypothetical protein